MRGAYPVLLFIGIACLATAVGGDVLVTGSGETIETQGPWKVKGRQVIFTNAQGVLSSLRLADIDIEASEAATKQAAEPAEPAAVEPQAPAKEESRKSILTLTNANVGRADPASGIATAPASPGASGIRVTLGTVANGYSIQARVNGQLIPNFTGGQSQAVQLFHVDHPNRAKLAAVDQESGFANLFCLQEGENEIDIEYQPAEPASFMKLRFYMSSPTYSSAIFEFEQEERRAGSLTATFEVYAQMPEDHQTQILP